MTRRLPPIVVDASIAVKWVLDEPWSAEAQQLRHQWRQERRLLVVPSLFVYEISNVLYQRVRRGTLTADEAEIGRGALLSIRFQVVHPSSRWVRRAWDLATTQGHPATYDLFYVVAAEQVGGQLWTADRVLWERTREDCPWVYWLGVPASTSGG
jgi:predicted nucleic acid-binding protein